MIRESAFVRYLAFFLMMTNPIARSRGSPISSSTPAFVCVKGAPGMRNSFAELVDANDRRSGLSRWQHRSRRAPPAYHAPPRTQTERRRNTPLRVRDCQAIHNAFGGFVTILKQHSIHSLTALLAFLSKVRVLWPSSRHLALKLRVFVDFLAANLVPAVEGESDTEGDNRMSS